MEASGGVGSEVEGSGGGGGVRWRLVVVWGVRWRVVVKGE